MPAYKQGDIVLVRFPYTDYTNYKVRPALVVSNRIINTGSDVILAQMTTKKYHDPLRIKITNQDLTDPFRPPKTKGYVHCKKVAVMDQSIIYKKISSLKNSELLEEIIETIQSIFELEE